MSQWEWTQYDFTTCDWEKFQDVPLDEHIKFTYTIDKDKICDIYFGSWRINVQIKNYCCESFKALWNKYTLPKKIICKKPAPTSFSIKHNHVQKKTFMKNTLSFCFNNGDTLAFSNTMFLRIYEHFITLYYNEKEVFVTCI